MGQEHVAASMCLDFEYCRQASFNGMSLDFDDCRQASFLSHDHALIRCKHITSSNMFLAVASLI